MGFEGGGDWGKDPKSNRFSEVGIFVFILQTEIHAAQ